MNLSLPARHRTARSLAAALAALMATLALVVAPATALADDFTYENGTLGFFKWLGADAAVQVIEESPSNPIVGPYQDFSNMDSRSSAFNLDNLDRALDNIEYANQLRANHGAPESRVDPYLMAISEINTNFSSANPLEHSNAYANVSENIAWGFENPYSRWYYDEKAEWESEELRPAREHMESLLANGVRYEDARAEALNYIRANYVNASDIIYGNNGHYGILHYLNLIHPMWTYTGAASVGPMNNWWNPDVEVYSCDEQTFYWTTPSTQTYTVAEFRAKLNEYRAFISGERSPFTDVSVNDWFYGNVKWAYDKGLMRGYGSTGLFRPYNTLTRAELAGVLYNSEGQPPVDPSVLDVYTDVPSTEWYASAVAWVTATNVMGGDGSGRFNPTTVATREQMVTAIWHMEGDPAGTGDVSARPDGDEVSDFAYEAMEWALGVGVINGNGSTGAINPTGSLNRSEAAAILMNWYDATGRK